MAKTSFIEEKAYNQDRFFFWFGTNYKLVKVFDRKYCVDHKVGSESFDEAFKEAVSKLSIAAIMELKGRVVETRFKKICDDSVLKKAQTLTES